MSESLDDYELLCISLGQLCRTWALLDRELNHLIATILRITENQAACLATEMPDIAGRCRVIKTTSHTIDVPSAWRGALANVGDAISNRLCPERNRVVHDFWYEESEAVFKRLDRRARLRKPQAFEDLKLSFDEEHSMSVDSVDDLTIRTMAAACAIAEARFDVQHYWDEGRFPEPPQLNETRAKRIALSPPPQDQ